MRSCAIASSSRATGAAPDASPAQSYLTGAPPTWRDVHAFAEERLLPFLTRLVVGTKQLSQDRGAADAMGAGTFAQWRNKDEPPSFGAGVLAFKEYLEDTKNVPVPQETHIGGSDRWGTKQQLVDLRTYLEKTWKVADPALAAKRAKARADNGMDSQRWAAGASAEDAMR